MKYTLGRLVMFCGLLVWASSASAHHALQAQFNTLKPLQLKGTLARIDWVNPHAYFWLDIKDETGKATQWGCETVGPERASSSRIPARPGVVQNRRDLHLRRVCGHRRLGAGSSRRPCTFRTAGKSSSGSGIRTPHSRRAKAASHELKPDTTYASSQRVVSVDGWPKRTCRM